MEHEKGYTLIELMVVVAIIGILALIAIPQLNKFKGNAQFSDMESTVRKVALDVTNFFAEASETPSPITCDNQNNSNSMQCNLTGNTSGFTYNFSVPPYTKIAISGNAYSSLLINVTKPQIGSVWVQGNDEFSKVSCNIQDLPDFCQ